MSPLSGQLYKRLAESSSLEGMDVIGVEDARPAHLARLAAALKLIRRYAPWIYQHATRDIDGLGICEVGGPRFGSWVNFVWISTEWLEREDEEWIAASLVYSLTLARLRRAAPSRQDRFRRLRVAFERQLSFARRLPQGIAMVERLTMAWDSGWYLPNVQREMTVRNLKKLGAPAWLLEAFKWAAVRAQGR